MSKLKFRQAIYVAGKFSHWHYWGFIDSAFIGPDTGTCTPDEARENSCQFIDFCDKNGKEIYGGDIDGYDGEVYLIEYGIQEVDAFEGLGWNMWSFFEDDGNGFKANGKKLSRSIEIIGNVHESPELLNEIR